MYDVTAIGEALIDFIPAQRDCALKEVESFTRVCGGAPTNVAAVVAKLQGNARLLTQVGNDAFGDYIVDTIQACGVKTDGVCRTDAANTALAFVSLKADGNRDFSFYRKPRLAFTAGTDSADLAGGNRYPALLLGFSGRIPNERNP